MKTKPIIIVGVLLLAIVGAYFTISSMSIIDTGENVGDKILLPYSCDVIEDCFDAAIADGALTEQHEDFDIMYDMTCVSQTCVAVVK